MRREIDINLTNDQKRSMARLFASLQSMKTSDPSYDRGYEDALDYISDVLGFVIEPEDMSHLSMAERALKDLVGL